MKTIAVSNNDIALAAWTFDRKLTGCVGSAVYRIDMQAGTETPLPALAGFNNDPGVGKLGNTTEQAPVQKFWWKDVYAKRGGLYKYKVVPLEGTFPDLKPMAGVGPLVTNVVALSPNHGIISSYFNRGILATQATASAISANGQPPSKGVLLKRINQPGDPLRASLAGDMISALKSLLERARAQGGACYGALYELTDPELLQELVGAPFVHLVLSDAGTDDSENAPARTSLEESGVDVTDRLMPKGHIGHNKFLVYAGPDGKPAAVLLGSTNWTATGLCAQTNNSLIVESPSLAAQYLTYWQRLKQDSIQADGDRTKLQSTGFRAGNNHVFPVDLEDHSGQIDLWFAPNTMSKSKTKVAPGDMKEVFDLIAGAKHAVLFLVFQPGTPSIVDAAADAQKKDPNLLVRGAVTAPAAAAQFDTDLYHGKGGPDRFNVVPATGIQDQFSVWERELNSAGHAIIHDKIVVIDPFDENCVVVTGSHNLGYKASSSNDENLVIIKGDRGLAEAYATHVLDVYDHYRWRYTLNKTGYKDAFRNLDPTDAWQDKYFDAHGRMNSPELTLWLSFNPDAAARRDDAGVASTRAMPALLARTGTARPRARAGANGRAGSGTRGRSSAPARPGAYGGAGRPAPRRKTRQPRTARAARSRNTAAENRPQAARTGRSRRRLK